MAPPPRRPARPPPAPAVSRRPGAPRDYRNGAQEFVQTVVQTVTERKGNVQTVVHTVVQTVVERKGNVQTV